MIKGPVYFFSQQVEYFRAHNTGIQRVTRQLAKALLELGIDLVPVEWDFENERLIVIEKDRLEAYSKYDGPSVDSWNATHVKNSDLVDGVKYLICPDLIPIQTGVVESKIINFAKDRGIKTYFIFHDAIPAIFRDWYHNNSQSHVNYMRNICEADGIFTVSESAKRDFIHFMPEIGRNKINAILLPNELTGKKSEKEKSNTKNINMLCVSTVEARKNHKRMLEAFRIARGMLLSEGYTINLTLVGTMGGWPEPVDAVKHAIEYDSVLCYTNVSDRDLKNLYANADFTIYPSEYEGYGLPIVESLSMNTPVLCSDRASMPEIASNGGCLMFDPYNIQDMANKIYVMATDHALRRKMVRGIEDIPRTTWKQYAKKILSYIGEK